MGVKVAFLTHFPERTNPYWNMKADGDVALKLDIIWGGQETVGSAERETCISTMWRQFQSIDGGAHKRQLYDLFWETRVKGEMAEYLSLPMQVRAGGGIGLTRLLQALRKDGKL